MVANDNCDVGEVTMAEVLSVLRNTRTSELLGVVGKLIGVGLFAGLIYSYCNVLVEACVRAAR
ncbi:MAG: hypothetical protein ABUS79_20325 [Pseudomonadota bacterium]